MSNADMPAMPLAPREGGGIQTIDKMDAEFIRQCNGAIGLTKREYFAANALPRIESVGDAGDDAECARRAARLAVVLADALLAELEHTGGGS